MRALFFLLAVVFAAVPSVCRADDPLAQHRAFAGWSASDAPAWHASGTFTSGGNGVALNETHRGVLFRDTIETAQGVSSATGFNGRLVWKTDENGFVAVQLGRPAQAAIALDILRSESVGDLHPAVAGHTTYNGRGATILQIQPAGLPPIQIYEDETGAFVRAVVAPGAREQQIFDGFHYTQLGARRFLSSWHAPDGDYRLTQFELATVADADLQPAPAAAQWSFGSSHVPFYFATLSDNARIARVAASVNGHTGTFILSTGTPGIVLYADFAHAAGVQDVSALPVSPFSGNVNFAGLSRVNQLRVGDSVLRNVVVTRITSPANQLAGVLGYDFFASAIVNVDLGQSYLSLSDPATAALPGPSGYSFPIDLSTRTPVVSIALPQGEMRPEIDTALPGFIMTSQALRDSGKLSGHDLGQSIAYTDWHATSTAGSCIKAENLFIGPYKYENPPVCFGGTDVFGADGGVIGLDFLRHFNWAIDYPHARFVVTPNGE